MDSRRSLLKKTLGGAALLAVAGAVPVALRKTRLRETGRKLLFFTAAEYSIWVAVADRVLAGGAGPSPSEVDVAGKADAFLAPLPESDRKDLKALLALFDNALFSFLTGGSPRPFTQMTADDQDAHLLAWRDSRLAIR